MTIDQLAKKYAPYDTLPSFWEGVKDYQAGVWGRDDQYQGHHRQAYDRGLECGMRASRQ
jgi:hypothetical protein